MTVPTNILIVTTVENKENDPVPQTLCTLSGDLDEGTLEAFSPKCPRRNPTLFEKPKSASRALKGLAGFLNCAIIEVVEEKEQNNFPDQELFEPEEIEGSVRGRYFTYFRTAIGLVFILAILYLGGFYQGGLLRQTPEDAGTEKKAQIVPGEELRIGAVIYILADREEEDAESIQIMLENASNIWAQAGITLVPKQAVHANITDEQKEILLKDPRTVVSALPFYSNQNINIILTRELGGLNGVAYGGLNTLSVAEFTSHFDFRTLAHEVGHLLGLSHTTDSGRLMSQGSFGEKLTEEEALRARATAQNLVQ